MVSYLDLKAWKLITDYQSPFIGRVKSVPTWHETIEECEDHYDDPLNIYSGAEVIPAGRYRGRFIASVPILDLNRVIEDEDDEVARLETKHIGWRIQQIKSESEDE